MDLLDDDVPEPDVIASRPTASGVPIPFLNPETPRVPTLEGTLVCSEKLFFPKFLFVVNEDTSGKLPVRRTEVYARMTDLPKELQALVRKALGR